VKLSRILALWEDFITVSSAEYVIRVAKMIFYIFSATHFVACVWYWLGCVAHNDKDSGWVSQAGLEAESFEMLYSTSVHWAFAHLLLGEIDVAPTQAWERAYSVLIHCVGLIVFSSFVSSLTELMASAAAQAADRSKRNSEVRDYMESHLVSVKLSSCIENFRKHANRHADSQKLPRHLIDGLQNLPVSLAVSLSRQVYMHRMKSHAFFAKCCEVWHDHLGSLVHRSIVEECITPGTEVFVLGQHAEVVYIIAKGHASYTNDPRTSYTKNVSVDEGAWVSEPALWLGNWKRRGDLMSASALELFCLNIERFRGFIVEKHNAGLYACRFAELVAKEVNHSRIPFAAMSDVELDLEARAVFAESALSE